MSVGAPVRVERFVAAVHRRWVAVRALEGAGRGLAWGAGLAGGGLLIGLGHGALRGEWALGAMALAAMIGGLWGWVRRPSRLAAAIEADRQFNLHDLLGTALSITDQHDSAVSRTLRTLASDACAHRRAGAVSLRNWGPRRWIGLGTAVALVLGLAAITGPQSRPDRPSGSEWRIIAAPPMNAVEPARPKTVVSAADPALRPAEGGDERRPTGEKSAERDAPDAGAKLTDASNRPGEGVGGAGDGIGQSKPRQSGDPSVPVNAAGESGSGATVAAGGQPGHDDAATKTGSGGLIGSGGIAADRASPRPTASWDSAVESARRAVAQGAVPDRYRVMVKDYFDPSIGSAAN